MNPVFPEDAVKIFTAVKKSAGHLRHTQTVICPPDPFLGELRKKASGKKCVLGAQDVFWETEGAYTGEVSPLQLSGVGVKYVIIGHSERRGLGETDEVVNKKVLATLKAGLTPILCVGEKDRDLNGEYLHFVRNQVEAALNKVQKRSVSQIVIAYEPLWAIGEHAKHAIYPKDLREMVIYLRRVLSDLFDQSSASTISILYGGSVDEKNCGEFLAEGDADGLLVGRASVDAKKFVQILQIAEKI